MGGPYNIPRNYKGEDKILFIFSRKAFLYTAIGSGIGIGINFLISMFGVKNAALPIIITLGFIGFVIGTFKIPDTTRFEFTRKVGGEGIDEIIVRYIKFRRKNKRIYVYKEEESKDGE